MAEFLKKDFTSLVRGLLDDLSRGLGGRVALTDTTEGSVVGTLVEAFSRELAVAYAQLDQVYRLGYLDTADGAALDNVVALLGVVRRRGGFLQGTVTFSRAEPAPEAIPIPAGTLVAGKGTVPFETSAPSFIPRGETETTVAVRSTQALPPDLQPKKLEAMTAPGVLDTMPLPMLGVAAVTNRVRLIPQQADETDDELRERARRTVSTANLGTRASLELALRELGLKRVTVNEPRSSPGVVEVVVGDIEFKDDLEKRARRVIEETRPAGVQVLLRGVTWVWIQVEATLVLTRDFAEAERQSIREELQQTLVRYIDSLGPGESVRVAKVRNILASHDKVSEVIASPSESTKDALMRAYVERDGKPAEETELRRTRSGDVRVEPGERAGVDLERRLLEPFALKLEPPAPRVFLDVELEPYSPKFAVAVRAALQPVLDSMADGANSDPLSFSALYGALQGSLGADAFKRVRFLVLHERNGRAVELVREGDEDMLEPREVLEVRHVSGPGGGE